MLSKRFKLALGLGLGLVAGFLILQGCGKVTGDYNANQPPTVEIVNVPQDAWGVDTTYHYGMPFTLGAYGQPVVILSMQGSTMMENTEIVYSEDRQDTFQRGDDQDYTMDYAAGTLTPVAGGAMQPDSTYLIDFSFLVDNYYVFSYAPLIHWVGYDPDGFIDHYSYADVTDTAFIAAFRAASDPNLYVRQHEGEMTWHDTTAMEARIYLLTTEGDTTEHLFFVKGVDNMQAESQNIAFKTFYRSNNAPNNPQIKPVEAPDAEYTQNYVVQDTLFSLDNLTPLWLGISFSWKSSDPDDKELYQIPLQFTHYLVKTPGDTIWSWSDSTWTDTKQIQLYGLETGSYVLSAWTRDDGYTLCAAPATITFNVIRATFEHHILMVDETVNSGYLEVPGDTINAFWQSVLQNLEGELDNDNYVMDGVDVRFKDNSNTNDPALKSCPIPYALIAQYKLVMIYNDDHTDANKDVYIPNRDQVLARYLNIGGNVWIEGRRILLGWYSFSQGVEAPLGTNQLLGTYMRMETGFVSNKTDPTQKSEFKGALPVVEGLPEMQVDSNRVKQITIGLAPADNRSLLPEVDWFTRSEATSGQGTGQSVTLYTYNSITADTIATSPYVYNEDSEVAEGATPAQCTVVPDKDGLLAVYRVENTTKGVMGEVENFSPTEIIVSYPYGQPWVDSDVLEVDYKYDPISQMHLKPVAGRFENQPRISNTIEIQGQTITYYTYVLGYRTAVFTFPLFFMKNDQGQVEAVVKDMLDWFFYPTIHWQL